MQLDFDTTFQMIALKYPLDLNREYQDVMVHVSVVCLIFHVVVFTTFPILSYYNSWVMVLGFLVIYGINGPIVTTNHKCILFTRGVGMRFNALNKHIK